MDRDSARIEVRDNWETILQGITTPAQTNVNGRRSYVCPICGHGSHGDGLTINPRSKAPGALKCFGCDFSGDIIDLLQKVDNCGFDDAFKTAAAVLGITIDRGRSRAADDFGDDDLAGGPQRPDMEREIEQPKEPAKAPQASTGADYRAYYRECRDRLSNPIAVSYLSGRGISVSTAAECWLGYDPQADPANAPGMTGNGRKPHPCQRIIIPTSKSHYVGRSVDPNTPKQFRKLNAKDSKPGIFNDRTLAESPLVFVTEGAFDALSFIEVGEAAVALNSKSNGQALLDLLRIPSVKVTTFIICPDNDENPKTNEATQRQAQELCRKLRAAGYICIVHNVAGSFHDANDALCKDRAGFEQRITEAKAAAAQEEEKGAKPDNVEFYINNLMGSDLSRFKDDIKTGYANLDRECGGLYSGLYVIAAISSLGKTTFTHQMADQIAAAGTDVLFFSLEQSRLEMVTKSIARHMAKKDLETAVTSLSIRKGYLPPAVQESVKEYLAEVGDRLSVIEGNFDCDISFIGEYIRGYLARNKTGTKPVVMIDYLQVLAPASDKKQTVREAVDEAVTELKRISRDLDITIILISSVNRANYLTPIDFESLKESGGIEYTADVVWGLQLQCLNDPAFDKEKNIKEKREIVKRAKAATPRKVELVCLKNRYGVSSYCCGFDYYPAADLFKEDAGAEFTENLRQSPGDEQAAAVRF